MLRLHAVLDRLRPWYYYISPAVVVVLFAATPTSAGRCPYCSHCPFVDNPYYQNQRVSFTVAASTVVLAGGPVFTVADSIVITRVPAGATTATTAVLFASVTHDVPVSHSASTAWPLRPRRSLFRLSCANHAQRLARSHSIPARGQRCPTGLDVSPKQWIQRRRVRGYGGGQVDAPARQVARPTS